MTTEYYIPNATYPRKEVEILEENGFPIGPRSQVHVTDVATNGFARRDFLKGVGVMVVGFSMSGAATKLAGGSTTAEATGTSGAAGALGALADPARDQVDSYVVISADGTVTTFASSVELGQGTATGYRQVLADELYVSFAKTRIVLGDTGIVPADGGMSGSGGMIKCGIPIRRAAASARVKLFALAAARFGVTVDKLTVKDGVISVIADPSKSVSYAELIAGKRFDVKFDANVKVKPQAEYTVVGQSIPRFDLGIKLTGEEEYVHDVRLPGMVYARAIRPRGQSFRQHAVLESVDMNSVSGLKGLIKVVPVGNLASTAGLGGQFNFVGVVCEREEQAVEAVRKLKVTWAQPPAIQADLYDLLLKTGRTPSETKGGDVLAALATADKVLSATYKFPFQMHASLGSVAAVADVKKDASGKITSVTIWSGTQNTYGARTTVGNALGIPAAEQPDKITVIWRWGPGSYGSNNGNTVIVADAALLSAAVGRPVKLQWLREDTHGWESYGPMNLMNLKAGLDKSGKIIAYEFDTWGATVNGDSRGSHYTFGRAPGNFRYLGGNPTGGTFFLTAALRAPNQPAQTFGVESFVDELAAAVKADPVAFRLAHLDPSVPADARAMDVINAAAKKFGWTSRPSPNPANASNRTGKVRGRGFAYGPRDDAYVAHALEVEVDQSTGAVRVLRAVVAHDVGLIVNPECILQQIEGNVIQTTGRALYEEVTHDGYRVSSLDWQGYPILRTSEVPKVEAVLINRPLEPIGQGVGEATCVGVSAAINNAIFDATGVRIRQVPLNPARVKAALAQR